MANEELVQSLRATGRYVAPAKTGDDDLGPFKHLPGVWANEPNLVGRGWNIIALPFATKPGEGFNYRVLMNQYNETLKFTTVDKGVPNRGIGGPRNAAVQTDQLVVTLDYEQSIEQIAAADSPESGQAGPSGLAIHHEPGLWLHMLNERTDDLDIARLASIPHGDSALGLGTSRIVDGLAPIPGRISALPIGVSQALANPYLAPYKHFVDSPFFGTVGPAPGFPGFLPTDTTQLLELANQEVKDDVVRTTVLEVDTATSSGGVVNIPFIVKQANAADMKSTFWIQELKPEKPGGPERFRLQYLQVVMLDFFDRRDGMPGLIRWPHISINTLEKVKHA